MKSAVPAHKVLRLPRALQLKVLKVLRTKCRSCHETCCVEVLKVLCLPRNLHIQRTKCRSCHQTCYWRCSRCCACHEICSSSAQSAAPATKSVVEVRKVLRPPRNLQFQCTKCRSCHEICYWRCSKCCARHEICTSRFTSRSAAKAVCSGRRSSLCEIFCF